MRTLVDGANGLMHVATSPELKRASGNLYTLGGTALTKRAGCSLPPEQCGRGVAGRRRERCRSYAAVGRDAPRTAELAIGSTCSGDTRGKLEGGLEWDEEDHAGYVYVQCCDGAMVCLRRCKWCNDRAAMMWRRGADRYPSHTVVRSQCASLRGAFRLRVRGYSFVCMQHAHTRARVRARGR